MPVSSDLFGVANFDYEPEAKEAREHLNRSIGQRARWAHESLRAMAARARAAVGEQVTQEKERDVQP